MTEVILERSEVFFETRWKLLFVPGQEGSDD
jgi:hypothetical protein